MAAENLVGNLPNKVAGEYQRPLPRDIDTTSNGSNAWKDETGTYSWDKMGILPPALSVADFSAAPLTEAEGNIYIGTTDTTAVHADWDGANKYDWVRFTADTSAWSSITPSEGQMCYDTSSNAWYTSDTSSVGWLELQTVIGTTSYTSKVLNTGDWNMDSTTTISVAHGLSATEWLTIRNISVMIIDDAAATLTDLLSSAKDAVTSDSHGALHYIDSTDIVLIRYTTGIYDDATYDSTSYNRGTINFDYIKD